MAVNILAVGKIAIEGWDLAVIGVYFLIIIGIGIWAGIKRHGETESAGYFLAGSTLTWPLIGLGLFSTNISTTHMVGFAQEGYVNGLALGNFEWMAPFLLIIMSLFFAPFYLRSRVATLPDFLERRFSRASRDWLAFISIISAVVLHIAFSLYTGAIVFKNLFNIGIWTSIITISILTAIYTVVGGLLAAVLTGALQSIILVIGSIALTIIALNNVGGWQEMVSNIDPSKLTILRKASDVSANLPWYSVFLGYPVIGLWYWCADQTIVQRVLGAKDENHARIGPLFCGFLKILPVFIFLLPGIIYLAMANKGMFPKLEDSKDCYAIAITNLLPWAGFKGLIAAAMLAAIMSNVSGSLNSIATLFCYDLYKRWRPATPDHKMVVIGQVATVVSMVLGIYLTKFLGNFPTIFQGINMIICYMAPPVTTVFLFGILWKRASSKAANATLLFGTLLGVIVFTLDQYKQYTHWPINYLMAAFWLFLVCSAIMFFVSLAHPHKHTEESIKLVWRNPMESLQFKGWKGIGNYKVVAAALFIIMVALYIVFANESTLRFFHIVK